MGSLITLSNSALTVSINRFGAELFSILYNGHEYLWQGDASWWKRRSPVLFPVVGKWHGGVYLFDGKEYFLMQHGFARDMDFVTVFQGSERAQFLLKADDSTRELFPFDFELYITYELDGASVRVRYDVINLSDRMMPFQIGGHPAFNIIGYDEAEECQGFIRFDDDSSRDICISRDTFSNDALIYDDVDFGEISLVDKDGVRYVSVQSDFPVWGIWAPRKDEFSPFVCLEPWRGFRDLWVRLEAGESFRGGWSVCLG